MNKLDIKLNEILGSVIKWALTKDMREMDVPEAIAQIKQVFTEEMSINNE